MLVKLTAVVILFCHLCESWRLFSGERPEYSTEPAPDKLSTSAFSVDIGLVDGMPDYVARAASWLLSQHQNKGWENDSPRILVALLSTDSRLFKQEEIVYMSQKLTADIAMELIINETDAQLPLYRLAQHVRALLATCQDPTRFHGIDLVQRLRSRINQALETDMKITPSIILTLCLSNNTMQEDERSLYKTSFLERYDVNAFTSIAAACIMERSNGRSNAYKTFFDALTVTLEKYKSEIQQADVYTLALLLQALNAWENHPDFHKLENQRDGIKHYLLSMQDERGSFGDVLATYYALPAIAGRNLMNLHDGCLGKFAPNTEVPEFGGKSTNIRITLWFVRNRKVESNTITFAVSNGWSLFQAMTVASLKNPLFRFKWDETNIGKILYEIASVPNDAENNLYWLFYVNPEFTLQTIHMHSTSKVQDLTVGLDRVFPKDGDEFLFWYSVPEKTKIVRLNG